jgi:hypothetical protein
MRSEKRSMKSSGFLAAVDRIHHLRRTHYGAQSHTPRNRCVRFVADVAVGSRNTRFQAAC